MIVERIKGIRAPFYRPPLPEEESAGVHPDILTLMKQCWAEEPAERPSFDDVAKALKMINKGKSVIYCLGFVALLSKVSILYINVVWRELPHTSSSQALRLCTFCY